MRNCFYIKISKSSISIKIILLVCLFCVDVFQIRAQEKNEWVERADEAFKREDYQNAITYYLKVVTKEITTDIVRPYEIKPYVPLVRSQEEPLKKGKEKKPVLKLSQPAQFQQYLSHQLAESYRLNHDYKNAELWYKKVIDSKPPLQFPFDHFWYGDALVKNGRCKAAVPEFQAIIKMGERKNPTIFQQAKVRLAGCQMVSDSIYQKKEITVAMLDSVFNGGSASFSANYYGDSHTLQFTNASNEIYSDEQKKSNPQFDCDIYTITKTETGWDRVIKMENTINTDEHEAAGCVSADKNYYYFTRWSNTKNECAIYVSKMRNQQWLIAEKLPENVNLSGFKSMHPFLTKDGTRLYYSSNRPGGMGKMDIWYVQIGEQGKPEGNPVNLGIKINTSEDEVTPFVHVATSTFFYSSNGLPGFGGLDVYKSLYDPDSLWSTPKNLGAPINSNKDDAYFVMDRDQLSGFVSSDREDCKSCSGGACYKLYTFSKKANDFYLKGTIYDGGTNRPMPGVLLTFKDIHGEDDPFYATTDSLGSFNVRIKEGRELYIKAQKNGYFGDANTLSTQDLTESKEFSNEFFLSAIPNEDMLIPGIEYEPDQATLTSKAKEVLDHLADFLLLNNNIKVEISSHTDERGEEDYNLKLSQDRARNCVDYLISKGVAPERMIPSGYGETKPLVPHAETEEDHQKNRRTVLRTLSEEEIKEK